MEEVSKSSVNSFKILNIPIDRGKTWRQQPILGKSKTIRGFVVGVALAVLVTMTQKYLFEFDLFKNISLINYSQINFFLLGTLLGLGALLGDALESFVKRRRGIKPSESWKIWDQIDYVIGSLIVVWFFVDLSLIDAVIIIGISIILTIIANHIGYYLKIRQEKW